MAERSVNVKLRMDVAAYMAGARAASGATRELDKAARDLRRALDEEENAAGRLRVAQARLAEVQKSAKAKASELAAAQEDVARASRTLAVAQDNSADAAVRFSQAQKDAANEAERSSKKIEDSMSRMAKRSNAQFDALKFTALTVGMPAAAAIGVAATAGVLLGGAALFMGVGIAAAAGSEKVQSAWDKTATHVVARTSQMAEVFEGPLLSAVGDMRKEFDVLAPQINEGMQYAALGVDELADSAIGFAHNAMPGMVTAAKNSLPVIEGVRMLSLQAGSGVNEMFTNMARGSEDAGAGLAILGGTTRNLLGFVGALSANLAEEHEQLYLLDGALNAVEGAMLDATAGGSGFVGLLSGTAQAGTGAITVISGLLSLVSQLPPQLTQTVGSVAAANMILSRFGVDGAAGFAGFMDKVRAAPGPIDKLKAAGQGLVQGAFGPAALATVGLGVLLGELGRRQQEAAAKAQEHQQAVQRLTAALREDGGVLGATTSASIANSLASKNAAGNAAALGISMRNVQGAAEGNAIATLTLQKRNEGMIDAWQRAGKINEHSAQWLRTNGEYLLKNGGAAADLANDYGNLTAAEQNQVRAMQNLLGAVGSEIVAMQKSRDANYAAETALTGQSRATLAARDAALELYSATMQLNNAQLGLRGAVLNTQEAEANLKKVMDDGKATVQDKEKALLQLETAQQAQIDAAYKQGVATSNATSENARNADGMRAANAEAVKLASSFAGTLPASLQQTIAKMSVTEAQAAGLKVEIDNTGAAVYRLPDGRTIKLTGDNAQAMAAINEVQRQMNAVRDKTVTITVQQRYAQTGGIGNAISQTGRAVAYAKGGIAQPWATAVMNDSGNVLSPMSGSVARVVPPNTWRVVGDNMTVPELFAPLDGSTRTRRLIIEAARHEKIFPMADGGILSAAREALAQLQGGGQFFEDFSFYGNSNNLSAYNDELADLFYKANPGFDFDASARARDGIVSWLSGYVAKQTPVSTVQKAIQSGNVVTQAPTYAAPRMSGSAKSEGGEFVGNLYLDNGQFLGVVRGEMRRKDRDTRRSVATRAGVAR